MAWMFGDAGGHAWAREEMKSEKVLSSLRQVSGRLWTCLCAQARGRESFEVWGMTADLPHGFTRTSKDGTLKALFSLKVLFELLIGCR